MSAIASADGSLEFISFFYLHKALSISVLCSFVCACGWVFLSA